MAISDELKRLVAQMPDPDSRGMYTTDIDKEKIEKAVAEIAGGGKEHVLGLIEMLGEPGTDEDVKPHYALHCVVNYALVAGDEKLRKDFCDAMASQLDNGDLIPCNRAYLCQELQWAGRDEACPALGKVLLNEDLTEPAALALAAIGGECAASPLRAAAPKAAGKCRLSVIDALAALADPRSAATFQEAMKDDDREVRLAAGSGLAKLGDASAINLLLKAADCEPGWERIQQTKHCLVLAEQLAAAGKKDLAEKIYSHLRETRTDPSEKYVRDLAEAALS
ncbi:MAG: HEAT repeat domain-containing protein [Pirellulales bacterium]|nr:HEAT repeat domain-containing protein [Pirellulales bacterium]